MKVTMNGNMYQSSFMMRRRMQCRDMIRALLCVLFCCANGAGSVAADSNAKQHAPQRTETVAQRIQDKQSQFSSLSAPVPPPILARRLDDGGSPVAAPFGPFAPFAPMEAPIGTPTGAPISLPTQMPSTMPPSGVPVSLPTQEPSTGPPTEPVSLPTQIPSTMPPTGVPISLPTQIPSTVPPTEPMSFPTQIPSTLPPTEVGTCYTSVTELNEDERQATDLDVVRNYVLCRDSMIDSGENLEPLWLRKNMHIFCGQVGGSSENNCTLTVGVASSVGAPFDAISVSENVLVQGITFTNNLLSSAFLALPGDFTFIDCIVRDNIEVLVSVQISWDGGPLETMRARGLQASPQDVAASPLARAQRDKTKTNGERRRLQNNSTLLRATFDNCRFLSNTSGSRLVLVGIDGNGTDVQFINCLFQNNDFNVPGVNDATGFGAIVDNFGAGSLDFTSTCWVGNRAVGGGLVTTAGEGATLPTVLNNFGEDNEVVYTVELECEFAALYDYTDPNFGNLACADFDSDVCSLATEPPTTRSPTAPFVSPTDAPSAAPAVATPAPIQEPTLPGACYTSLNQLDADERAVADTSVVRNYVLCENTVFVTSIIGTGGDPENRPLTIRENMYIWCGEIGGSSDNNCTIVEGTMLTAIPTTFDPPSLAYDNVLVQGVTFRDSKEFVLFIAGLPGDIRFVDCIFIENTGAGPPILIDFIPTGNDERQLEATLSQYHLPLYENSSRENAVATDRSEKNERGLQDSVLSVDFTDCIFRDNGAPLNLLGVLVGPGIDVKFSRCLFENNDFNVQPFGAIFEIGGAVEFESNCFFSNKAFGNGLVVSFAEEIPVTSNNFGQDNEIEYSADVTVPCEFVAFERFEPVVCAEFDTTTCAIDTSPSPESPNTPAPVVTPAPSPVVEPTDVAPTMMGSKDMPTMILTGPDAGPVESPNTELPTSSEPSVEPEQGPTLAPMEPPSFVFTPNLTPNMITPSLFSPAMFSPVFFEPSIQTPAIGPTFRSPDKNIPDYDASPVTLPRPSIDVPMMSPTIEGSNRIVVDKTVDVVPFIVQFTGSFELTDDVTFTVISTINELVAPFLMGHFGEILDDIYLDMKFMDTSEDKGRNLKTDTIARMEVSGELDLKGDGAELQSWNSERATQVLKAFFDGANLSKLFSSLKTHGLPLDEITTQDNDGTGDSAIVSNEGSSTTPDTDTSGSNNDSGSTNDTGGFANMSIVMIAAICAGVACIGIAAALFVIGRRRKRKRRNGRELESFADSFNLRSGQDDLPDCNASVAASHVSFPDVFNDEDEDKGEPPGRRENRYEYSAATVEHDEYDDLLDNILDDDDSLRAVNHHKRHHRKKKKRHHRRPHNKDVEKASEWAKKVKGKHVGLSAPQRRDSGGYDDYF